LSETKKNTTEYKTKNELTDVLDVVDVTVEVVVVVVLLSEEINSNLFEFIGFFRWIETCGGGGDSASCCIWCWFPCKNYA
jgi:hypothetical protein